MVEMFSQLGCAEEDTEVDSQLGYPPVYVKLCRHALAVELPMPFTEGAPQRFLPYSPQAEDVNTLTSSSTELLCLLTIL